MTRADKKKIEQLLIEFRMSIVFSSSGMGGRGRHHLEIEEDILDLIEVDSEPEEGWIPNVPQWFKDRKIVPRR